MICIYYYVCVCVCVCVSCSVMSDYLWPHGLQFHQIPLSMEFTRQECWNGLPFSSPGGLPHPRIKRALQADSLLSEPPGKPYYNESPLRREHNFWIRGFLFPNTDSEWQLHSKVELGTKAEMMWRKCFVLHLSWN